MGSRANCLTLSHDLVVHANNEGSGPRYLALCRGRASFSRKNKKKVRQLENVPRRVYTPTFAPSLPKNTVTYHQVHYFEKGAGEQSSAARTKTKIATVGKSMPSLSQSAPAADPNANAASSNSSSRSIVGKKNAKHRAEEVVMKRLHN